VRIREEGRCFHCGGTYLSSSLPKKKNMHVMICAEDEDVVEIGEQGTNELDKLNT